ncbi:hypothetical protein C8R46DRAFT_1212589 [Mycena filopes]|nr:hypothetical protein C8R46DRAFT_1212589 [Mycena filopes]
MSSPYASYPYRHYTSQSNHPFSMLPPMDSVEDQIQDLLLLSEFQNAATAQIAKPGMMSRIFLRLKNGARRGIRKVKTLARRRQ